MTQVLIPPWIQPQSENSTLVDDSTAVFRPAYAPGLAQRNSTVEPRLNVKQGYKGLRGFERAIMTACLARAKGRLNTVRALVGYARRGSFPSTEIVSNNTYANSFTGFAAYQNGDTVSVVDRVLRIKRTQAGQNYGVMQNPLSTLTAFAPYVARGSIIPGVGPSSIHMQFVDTVSTHFIDVAPDSNNYFVAPLTIEVGTASYVLLYENSASGGKVGDYFDVPWLSVSRCALVDNGPNAFVNSDTVGLTGWNPTACTISTTASPAPDQSATIYGIVETATTAAHYVGQTVTISTGEADYTLSYYVKQGTRGFCWVSMGDGTNAQTQWFNLGTGALGTSSSSGTGVRNPRAAIQACGNGWYRVSLTAEKVSGATSLIGQIGAATADGTTTYLGVTGSPAIYNWRAQLGQSSQPSNANVATTTALPSGTQQTGNYLNIKGLPVSTNGLLLAGDMVEINGELKLLMSSLDSDAMGLGRLHIAPAMFRSPADGDAVVINQPMGKFILADNASWDNLYGAYADVDLSLEAIAE